MYLACCTSLARALVRFGGSVHQIISGFGDQIKLGIATLWHKRSVSVTGSERVVGRGGLGFVSGVHISHDEVESDAKVGCELLDLGCGPFDSVVCDVQNEGRPGWLSAQ